MEQIGTAVAYGVRLAALVLTVSFIGLALFTRMIEGEFSGFEAGISLLFVSVLLTSVVFFWNSPFAFVILLLAGGLLTVWSLGVSRAEVRLLRKTVEKEEKNYRKAIEKDPRNAAAWSALGDIYWEQRRYQDAIRCYEEVLKITPTDAAERAKLRRAQRLLEEIQRTERICPECKAAVSRWAVPCPQCGSELAGPVWLWLVAAVREPKALGRFVASFLISFLILSVYFFLLSVLPPLWRSFLILSTMLAVAIVVWVEMRD